MLSEGWNKRVFLPSWLEPDGGRLQQIWLAGKAVATEIFRDQGTLDL